MIMLRITGCRDPQLWYAGMEGCYVACLGYSFGSRGPSQGCWKSLEPAGYVNFVREDDAVPVEVLPEGDRELTVPEVLNLLRSFRRA